MNLIKALRRSLGFAHTLVALKQLFFSPRFRPQISTCSLVLFLLASEKPKDVLLCFPLLRAKAIFFLSFSEMTAGLLNAKWQRKEKRRGR